jgi:integrase
MLISGDLLRSLAAFHIEAPQATWSDLRAHLQAVAEDCLGPMRDREAYDMIYGGLGDYLPVPARSAQSVRTREASKPVTFEFLADLYKTEQQGNVQPSTLKEIATSCRVIAGALGELDLKTHTRADMVALKETLMKTRKGSTVNKLLNRLSVVMDWAVNNDYLTKSFDKGLKLTKGAESSREAFTPTQVDTIMRQANSLPADSWHRWVFSLGAVTGARIGEIYQLTKDDIKQVGDVWVIDINDDNGKTLKNKHSARIVPLTNGAYGFDLAAFLSFVDASGSHRLFTAKEHWFNKPLNEMLRGFLKLESGGNLSFHSLRHSMAGSMKAAEVPLGIAQSVLGHSSGSITFDLYGAGRTAQTTRMAEALRDALMGI